MITNIDGKTLQKMFLAGAKNLEAKKEWINELNVFPVPDGDTGTNMTLTIMSAAKEVEAIENPTMVTLSKAISSGSLRGARGNSGVILSQLFRGFTKEIKQFDTVDAVTLANACERAVETAYKAVMKPKEGTILTVAKGVAEKAREVVLESDDLEYMIDEVIKYGDEVLNKTPDMLPVLKQAGVVDSGGQGLMQVLKGAQDAFLGKELDFEVVGAAATKQYTYAIKLLILTGDDFDETKDTKLKAYLDAVSSVEEYSKTANGVSISVLTDEAGVIISKSVKYGQITNVSIENLKSGAVDAKAEEPAKADEPRKEVGFIAVSIGDGMNEILRGLGVDEIIEGGQTMNPSTEDVLNAIDKVNADAIFVLPNNKNIILAAEQAASLTEDKKVVVIPSKTVPQGINAIINYMQGTSVEENKENMIAEMANVKTGSVTYAVRDTVIDDKTIKQNDIMGIGDAGIVSVGTDIAKTTLDMISNLIDEDSEIISIYYGSDVTEDDANALTEKVQELYSDIDVDVNYGGQPIYYYVVSVE